MIAPAFMQALPPGDWEMIAGDKQSGQLRYRSRETGAEVLVPSVWYNQPISWRVDYFRYCSERARDGAKRLRVSNVAWAEAAARDAERRAAQLDACADEMERTGRFVEVGPAIGWTSYA